MTELVSDLRQLIIMTSAYYGQKLDDIVVKMYANDLKDINLDDVFNALNNMRRDPKITRFPLPAVIRAYANPKLTEEGQAIEAVSRIIAAVSKIGPYRNRDARQFIGELGWSVVEGDGGWEHVCGNLTSDNIGTLRAQWTKIAMTKIQSGFIEERKQLDWPQEETKKINANSLLKRIPHD